jgi:hypothetical protein
MLKKTEGRFRYVLEMSEESGMVEPVLVFDHEGEETHVPLGEKVCLEDLIVTIKTK